METKPQKRCIVNIAGVYFQLFCLIGLLCFFFFAGYDILRYMILMMDLGLLMTLNPFSSLTAIGLSQTCWECQTCVTALKSYSGISIVGFAGDRLLLPLICFRFAEKKNTDY